MDRIAKKKLIKEAKARVNAMEGSGVFSTAYYVYLFDNHAEMIQAETLQDKVTVGQVLKARKFGKR